MWLQKPISIKVLKRKAVSAFSEDEEEIVKRTRQLATLQI
jgi:hypothetical protein